MNVKRDKITDALDAFWGAGSQTEVPSPQVDTTPEDIIETIPYDTVSNLSQEVSSQQTPSMTSGSKSVKEMVEDAIKNKQNKISGTPSSEIVEQYSPKSEVELRQRMMPSAPAPQQGIQSGFAGFDQKLANQFAMERGGGIDLGGPMSSGGKLQNQFMSGMTGNAPMGGGAFGFGMGMGGRPPMQREDPRLRRKADLALDNYAKQMGIDRQMRMADLSIARSQQAQKARYQSQLSQNQAARRNITKFDSGLPVYENWLDPLFGGKTKKKEPIFSTSETKKPIYKEVTKYKDEVTTKEEIVDGKVKTLTTTRRVPFKTKELVGFETKIDKKYAGMQEKIGSTPGFFGLMAGGLNTVYEGGGKELKRGYNVYKGSGGYAGLKSDYDYMTSTTGKKNRGKIKQAKKESAFGERQLQDESELERIESDMFMNKSIFDDRRSIYDEPPAPKTKRTGGGMFGFSNIQSMEKPKRTNMYGFNESDKSKKLRAEGNLTDAIRDYDKERESRVLKRSPRTAVDLDDVGFGYGKEIEQAVENTYNPKYIMNDRTETGPDWFGNAKGDITDSLGLQEEEEASQTTLDIPEEKNTGFDLKSFDEEVNEAPMMEVNENIDDGFDLRTYNKESKNAPLIDIDEVMGFEEEDENEN